MKNIYDANIEQINSIFTSYLHHIESICIIFASYMIQIFASNCNNSILKLSKNSYKNYITQLPEVKKVSLLLYCQFLPTSTLKEPKTRIRTKTRK